MEAQQKAIENILESREISSPLLRLLLDTTSSVSPLSSALNTTSSVAPLPIKSSTLDSTSLFTQSLNPSQRSAVETAIKNPITSLYPSIHFLFSFFLFPCFLLPPFASSYIYFFCSDSRTARNRKNDNNCMHCSVSHICSP